MLNIEVICKIRHNENLPNFKSCMNDHLIINLLSNVDRSFKVKDNDNNIDKVLIVTKKNKEDITLYVYKKKCYTLEELTSLKLESIRDKAGKVIYYDALGKVIETSKRKSKAV